jgi:hypothetical protein
VTTRFAAHPFRFLTMLAAWLVVLQAFLAGVTAASAAVPLSELSGTACHGTSDGSSGDPPDPGPDRPWHLCCAPCLFGLPALPVPHAPAVTAVEGAAHMLTPRAITVIVGRGTRRVGQSQAPPGQA